jgi:glycosyltransferase involved in cell wall biosynthesis
MTGPRPGEGERVLHVHRIGGIGGSERHLLALLPALRERGVDASVLGLDDPARDAEPFYEQLAVLQVPYERLPCPRDLDPRLAGRTVRAVRARRPDLVHTHLVHADVYGALAAWRAGTGLVSTKHNDDPFRAGPFRFAERTLTRRASRVICITAALARFNRERVGLPATKLRIVHYGLDTPPGAWGTDGGPPLPEDARVLLAVGRLERQKGLDVALRALATVRRDHPAAHLVVLGEGSLREELTALAAELGLGGAVHLPGRVGDVGAWLQRADLLVHPARWEGFGLALLEAMLCARPVVATRVSSIPEIVVDGETGLLVAPDDAPALAEAVGALLSDAERARAMGAAGVARAQAEFSVAKMADRTLAVYREAIASARR